MEKDVQESTARMKEAKFYEILNSSALKNDHHFSLDQF